MLSSILRGNFKQQLFLVRKFTQDSYKSSTSHGRLAHQQDSYLIARAPLSHLSHVILLPSTRIVQHSSCRFVDEISPMTLE